MNAGRGWLFVPLQALFAAAMILAARGSERSESLPLIALALVCSVLALALVLRAAQDLGSNLRVQPEPRSDGNLVRHGIYARLRHPMYSSVMLFFVAILLMKPSWLSTAAVAMNAAFYFGKARFEERRLAERFPDYAEYKRRSRGVFGI